MQQVSGLLEISVICIQSVPIRQKGKKTINKGEKEVIVPEECSLIS